MNKQQLNKQITRQVDTINSTNDVVERLKNVIKDMEVLCNKEFEKIRNHVMILLWDSDKISNLLRTKKYSKEEEERLTNKMRKAARDAQVIQRDPNGPLKQLEKKCKDAMKEPSDRLQYLLTANSKRMDLLRKLSARAGKKQIDMGDKRRKRKSKSKSKRKRKSKRKSKSQRKSKKSCKKGYRRNRSTRRCRKI